MKSMPASSAMRASRRQSGQPAAHRSGRLGGTRRQSGQLADQRSGTLVAERPDEQLAPKMPIFRALELYIATRSRIDTGRSNKTFSIRFPVRSAQTRHGSAQLKFATPSIRFAVT